MVRYNVEPVIWPLVRLFIKMAVITCRHFFLLVDFITLWYLTRWLSVRHVIFSRLFSLCRCFEYSIRWHYFFLRFSSRAISTSCHFFMAVITLLWLFHLLTLFICEFLAWGLSIHHVVYIGCYHFVSHRFVIYFMS